MTVNVGVMQLPVTEDPDPVRTYLNGTHPSGGLWTALTRASNHDHSGGLNGVVLGATSIPDGSITTAKLDPSVLLPYALVDGSKPFTGQVTLNADAILRDTLFYGAKPAGVADATLKRTGAGLLRIDKHLGIRTDVRTDWRDNDCLIQMGGTASVSGGQVNGLFLRENSYTNTAVENRAFIAGKGAASFAIDGDFLSYATAPAVAAGALQTFYTRLQITATGNLLIAGAANGMGVGSTMLPWHSNYRVIDFPGGSLFADATAGNRIELANNSYVGTDGANKASVGTIPGCKLQLYGGALYYHTYPTVATGASQGQVTRFQLAADGNIQHNGGQTGAIPSSLAPASVSLFFYCPNTTGDGSQNIILADTANGWRNFIGMMYASADLNLRSQHGGVRLSSVANINVHTAASGYFLPGTDNYTNLGHPSGRWGQIYSSIATISTSHVSLKENFAPLDPAACVEAVLGTDWLSFDYKTPPGGGPGAAEEKEPEASDFPEGVPFVGPSAKQKADRAAHLAEVKAFNEAGEKTAVLARHQKGYVLGSDVHKTSDLFGLADRYSASTHADLAVVACALQDALRRLAALEAAN